MSDFPPKPQSLSTTEEWVALQGSMSNALVAFLVAHGWDDDAATRSWTEEFCIVLSQHQIDDVEDGVITFGQEQRDKRNLLCAPNRPYEVSLSGLFSSE